MVKVISLVLVMILVVLCASCSKDNKSRIVKVGVVNISPVLDKTFQGFKSKMKEYGYIEGKNITYLYKGPIKRADLQNEVQRLVDQKVDMIFSISTPATVVTQKVTKDKNISVVFAPVTDPIRAKIVTNLTNHGERITGVRAGTSTSKTLHWVTLIKPTLKKLAVLHNPTDKSSMVALEDLSRIARDRGVQLLVKNVIDMESVKKQMKLIKEENEAEGIMILPSGRIVSYVNYISEEAVKLKLPTFATSELAEKGILLTFGLSYYSTGEQAARLAHQILHGIEPGQLPIESAEYFLRVNMVTAKKINLEVPLAVLTQADQIIRQ